MEQKSNDYVVLVHGLGRSGKSLKKLEKSLSKKGYQTVNVDYPSRSDTIENLAEKYLKEALEKRCADTRKRIHFVTHSMGGMLVRYYLSKNRVENVGRLVMLAPPNKGSRYADFFSKCRITRFLLGQALVQMTSKEDSMPNTLPDPDYEVGVIAGLYDGKVTIEEAKLSGMTDFLIVPTTHTFIMNAEEVMSASELFLREGKFKTPANKK